MDTFKLAKQHGAKVPKTAAAAKAAVPKTFTDGKERLK